MMLLPIIILVIFIFVYLNPSDRGNTLRYSNTSKSNNALDILDMRFANGEINEEEYLRRKSLLS